MASSSAAAKVLDIGVQPLPLNGMESLEPETHVCLDPTCTTCLATGVSGMAGKDPAAPCCEPCSSPGPSACGSESADSRSLQKTHVCLDPDCAQCKATGSTATHGIQNWNDEKQRRPHVCLDANCARCKATGTAIGASTAQSVRNWNAEKKRPHVCLDPGCARCKATGQSPVPAMVQADPGPKTHVCLDPSCATCKATGQQPIRPWDQGSLDPNKHACGDPGCARCIATGQEPASPNYFNEKKRPHVCTDPSCARCKATGQHPPSTMVFADPGPKTHVCLEPNCERCLATGRHPPSTMFFADGKPKMHVCMDPDCERCLSTGRHPPERNWDATQPKMHVCLERDCERCLATGRHPPERSWDSRQPKMHVCLEPDCERCLATGRHPPERNWDATTEGYGPLGPWHNSGGKQQLGKTSPESSFDPIVVDLGVPETDYRPPLEPGPGLGTDCLQGQLGTSSFSEVPTLVQTPGAWGSGVRLSLDLGEATVDELDITSSPIIVGCWMIFAVHYKKGSASTPHGNSVLGLYLPDLFTIPRNPRVFELNDEGGQTEGTLLYDPNDQVIYWPHFASHYTSSSDPSSVTQLDARDFSTVAQHDGQHDQASGPFPMQAGCDSSGVLTPDGYVFGTVNTPKFQGLCNNTQEETFCGAVMRLEPSITPGLLAIGNQIDYSTHRYRTWVGGSVSAASDNSLYVGNTSQYAYYPRAAGTGIHPGLGGSGDYHNDVFEQHLFLDYTGNKLALYEDRYGCTVTKLAAGDFTGPGAPGSLPHFDPGNISNCREAMDETLPSGEGFKSSVAGEVVVPDDDVVWAQYSVDNYERGEGEGSKLQVYALDSTTMTPICEFTISSPADVKSTSFYQAPTLRSASTGWALFSQFQREVEGVTEPGWAQLVYMSASKTDPFLPCIQLLYDRLEGEVAFHSPTLAAGPDGGEYVMVATKQKLHIYDQNAFTYTEPRLTLDLGSGGAEHVACPIVYNPPAGLPGAGPVIILLSRKGFISVIPSPLVGVGPQGEEVRLEIDSYGDTVWPRFRADNCGSGRPDGDCA